MIRQLIGKRQRCAFRFLRRFGIDSVFTYAMTGACLSFLSRIFRPTPRARFILPRFFPIKRGFPSSCIHITLSEKQNTYFENFSIYFLLALARLKHLPRNAAWELCRMARSSTRRIPPVLSHFIYLRAPSDLSPTCGEVLLM